MEIIMKQHYEIKLDENLVKYLEKKKKNVITLTIKKNGGGCCPTFESADIDLKKPIDINNYNVFNIENIHIYVCKNAKVTAPVLKFELKKSFLLSHIVPLGLSLIEHS